MNTKNVPDVQRTASSVGDYEKPQLEIFPDYLDITLQQTIIIPTDIGDEL